ncbi:STAS domain-containing protein [Evansella clarkii]|uniref:STAS domain-containing protein n=1 Tax=Evansella clarkii TaxID=79879 RepID=UPI0009972928|nr:STAS domain-containing protein [Evansella clarkii]
MRKENVKVQVDSNEFIWDRKEGLFTFDGAPALLFWDTAIELFLETIEEVSGVEASKTVYEATGYRMGTLVSDYYQGRTDVENLLEEYSDIYRNAGWGKFKVKSYSLEEKRAVIQLTNSWEHRIFKDKNKDHAGVLLPSHWAGVFTGIFNEKMWYKINQSQLNGHEYDEIEIFPSDITPANNIHELAREKEQQNIMALERKVEERTGELTSLVMELSTPVIPVLEDILVIPMVGKFNESRLSDLMEKAMVELSRHKAKFLLIDFTGIKNFDNYTVHKIHQLTHAIRLLGGTCYLVGISSDLSIHITNSDMDLRGIQTFSTLQQGVEHAIVQCGFELVRKKDNKTKHKFY